MFFQAQFCVKSTSLNASPLGLTGGILVFRPLVTIITPTYNHESFIGPCIESVLNQSFNDWEMIIVDDGSTDKTLAIAEHYARRHNRINVVTLQHRGIFQLSETYNVGLSLGSAPYVAILEGDDFWPSTKLSSQVAIHQSTANIILSHGQSIIYQEPSTVTFYCHPPKRQKVTSTEYMRWLLCRQSCIMPVTAMINREALDRIGGFKQGLLPTVDFPTFLELSRLSGYFYYSDDILGYWRSSPKQQTAIWDDGVFMQMLEFALNFFTNLSDNHRESLHLASKDIIEANYKKIIRPSTLHSLRRALVGRDRTLAKLYAQRLVTYPSLKYKLEGLYGIVASTLGWNMEWILDFLSQFRLSQRQLPVDADHISTIRTLTQKSAQNMEN